MNRRSFFRSLVGCIPFGIVGTAVAVAAPLKSRSVIVENHTGESVGISSGDGWIIISIGNPHDGNVLAPGESVPRVIGTRRVFPPILVDPSMSMDV